MEQINLQNADETAAQLYLEAQTNYRLGQFQQVLDTLMRCIRAPKSKEKRELDVASYNMLGILYGRLGEEMLSKENLLKALKLAKEYDCKEEMVLSYVYLGFLHQKLTDLEKALYYIQLAHALIVDEKAGSRLLLVTCLSYEGIIYSKLGKKVESASCLAQIKSIVNGQSQDVMTAPVQNLVLRICYEQKNESGFFDCFQKLLNLEVTEEDFIRYAEFYLDICDFLLEKERYDELRRLLDYMREYIQNFPVMDLKYRLQSYELTCAKKDGTEEEQWDAMQKLFAILPKYEAEQQNSKLYSFDYIEYIHEEKSLSYKMEEKSKLDPMTGLLNKYTLEFLAEEYFKRKGKEEVAAVLVIDMDHFKQVNDTLGHLVGDAILTDTAAIIKHFFKEDTLCGRIGGDEFVIFIKDVKDISTMLIQAEFLRKEITKTTSERSITIAIQASIGIALTTAGFDTYASLFNAADSALYQAKKDGRNKINIIE